MSKKTSTKTKPNSELTREELVVAFRLAREEATSLEQTIDHLNREVLELRGLIDRIDEGWTLTTETKEDDPSLPIPRLELRWSVINNSTYRCLYSLVRKPLGTNAPICAHPLGEVESRGHHREATLDFEEGDGKPRLPMSLGAMIMHDSAHLGLPAIWISPEGDVVNLLDECVEGRVPIFVVGEDLE